jgi:hypothetical protein
MLPVFSIETEQQRYITAGSTHYAYYAFYIYMNDHNGTELWHKSYFDYMLRSMIEINNSVYLLCDSGNQLTTLMKIDDLGDTVFSRRNIPVANGMTPANSARTGNNIAITSSYYNNVDYNLRLSIIDTLGNILLDSVYNNITVGQPQPLIKSTGNKIYILNLVTGILLELDRNGSINRQFSLVGFINSETLLNATDDKVTITTASFSQTFDTSGVCIDTFYYQLNHTISASMVFDNHYVFLSTEYPGGVGWYALIEQLTDTIFATGINEKASHDLGIFPNPFSTAFQVSGKNIHAISLYDIYGKELFYEVNPGVIDAGTFPAGIYLFQVFYNDGSKYSGKILKQ